MKERLTGEPSAVKAARSVRRGEVGKATKCAARWPPTLLCFGIVCSSIGLLAVLVCWLYWSVAVFVC